MSRRPPFWRRFHHRLTLLYALPVLATLAVAGVLEYRRAVASEMAGLQGRLRGIAVSLSRTIDPADVASLDAEGDAARPAYGRLVGIFRAIGAEERDVSSIYVVRKTERAGWLKFAADWVRQNKKPAATVGQLYDATQTERMLAAFDGPAVEDKIYADEWGRTLSGYAPILDASGRAVGVVGVDVTAERVDGLRRRALLTTALLFGAAALLLALVGAFVGRWVRGPIERLTDTAEAIGAGRYEARVGLRRGDELGQLGARFDEMAAGLEERERIRATFGRYVSEEVARKVLASPEAATLGGEEREVTILFADIRGYSTIVEEMPPARAVELLNRYLGEMGTLIDRHGGVILEFLGDAILAVFGAPMDQPDHAARAVACARAMAGRLAELQHEWEASGVAKLWQDQGVAKLEARIGLHSGRVVAGNMGSATRVKYGVVGDAVNVAARVESLNNSLGTSLLATADVIARLPPEVAATTTPRGEHPVKGRDRTVAVHAL